MAILVTTVGADDANSYADIAFAQAYFEATGRFSEWIELDAFQEDGGTVPLLEAMTFIEMQEFLGIRVSDEQALEFPRYGGATKGWPMANWHWHPTDVLRDLRSRQWPIDAIPEPVKQAQCEQALALALNRRWFEDKYKSEKIAMATAEIEVANAKELGTLCRAGWLKLMPFLVRGGQKGTLR
jgi:hypothetical protein